ncbi:MAG TPA: glycosyltransferase family 2 protein [Polyangiales bacterium]
MSGATPSTKPSTYELSAADRARTFIVIAAFNEARAIGQVVRELREAAFPNVVVVDDGSRDDTADQARAAGAVVLTHLINRGQGAALQTGLSYALRAGADYLATFDADGQHDVADLPAMLGPIMHGEVEICLGSRFLGVRAKMPKLRRAVLFGAVLFTRITSRIKLTDAHNGLRALSRRAALGIDLQLDRMAHASEIVDQIASCGLSYREVPVHIRYTAYSLAKGQKSSAALRVAFDYLIGRVFR